VGVVVADAMPATPIPALMARAVAERPRAILFLRDIFCLLDLPSWDGGFVVCPLRDSPSVRREVLAQLLETFHSPVKDFRHVSLDQAAGQAPLKRTCAECKLAHSVIK
jgi:hypothetical protein